MTAEASHFPRWARSAGRCVTLCQHRGADDLTAYYSCVATRVPSSFGFLLRICGLGRRIVSELRHVGAWARRVSILELLIACSARHRVQGVWRLFAKPEAVDRAERIRAPRKQTASCKVVIVFGCGRSASRTREGSVEIDANGWLSSRSWMVTYCCAERAALNHSSKRRWQRGDAVLGS